MFKTVLAAVILLSITGCMKMPTIGKKREVQQERYVEFEDYNSEVVPKLDKGYKIVKLLHIKQRKNITPEEFENKMLYPPYLAADFVMVDTDIENGYYNFTAVYLKKIDVSKMMFGAVLNHDMPMEIREEFGSNKGCAIGKVYYDTPAYRYDLHENDVVVSVDGVEVLSCKHFKKLLKNQKVVDLELWNNGQIINVNGMILNK